MKRRTLYPLSTWLIMVLLAPCGVLALGAAVVAMTDADSLAFDHAHLWWLVAIGPLAGLLCLVGAIRKRTAMERFTSPQLAPLLTPRLSSAKQAFRAMLGVMAVLGIPAGIIGPRWGIFLEKQRVHGVDIAVALDVSRSMLAQDLSPNRLEAAKRLIGEQLIERTAFRGQHRLALLAFAGTTALRVPLTTDHLAFRTKLAAIQAGSVPRGGTAIAQAIDRAVELFDRSPKEATRLVLVFTDGEDHEGDPVAAAQTAWQEHGIRVFMIGAGDPTRTIGAEVPSPDGGARKPLLHEGQIVFSRLDEEGMRKTAEAGDGRYVRLDNFHQLVDAIADMRQTELTTEERIRRRPQYQWFIATSLLFLAIQTLMGEVRTVPHDLPRRIWQQEGTA